MLKFLSRVKIEFNALDPRTASCMEFLAQCNNHESKKSNPKCEIQVKRRVDQTPPKIAVTFVNGDEHVFDPASTPAQTIRETILGKSEMVKTEQMFRGGCEKWPVLIPDEELQMPFEGVKVTDLSRKQVVKDGNKSVTLQIEVRSFDEISEQSLRGFMGPQDEGKPLPLTRLP